MVLRKLPPSAAYGLIDTIVRQRGYQVKADEELNQMRHRAGIDSANCYRQRRCCCLEANPHPIVNVAENHWQAKSISQRCCRSGEAAEAELIAAAKRYEVTGRMLVLSGTGLTAIREVYALRRHPAHQHHQASLREGANTNSRIRSKATEVVDVMDDGLT
jgi:hypothetical protein